MTDELAERFAALARPADDSDWLEVRRLARTRSRRRPALLFAAAVAAALVAVAAPAFGLGGKLVRFFESGEPAPPRVQRSFASLDVGAPPGFATGVVAAETRQVVLAPEVAVWVAPTDAGGFCLFVAAGGGSCDPQRRLDFWPLFSIAAGVTPQGVIRGGPLLIYGTTTLDEAAKLEVLFEDGESVTVPVVWISSPIDAGFYGYSVPRAKWAQGHRPTTLLLRDAAGRELRRDSSAFRFPLFRRGPSTGLAECVVRRSTETCLDAPPGYLERRRDPTTPSGPIPWRGE